MHWKHAIKLSAKNIQPRRLFYLLTDSVLSTLNEKILRAFDGYEKIIICSDHRTSRLAVLDRQTKFDNAFPAEGRQIYKSGRFADAMTGDEQFFLR